MLIGNKIALTTLNLRRSSSSNSSKKAKGSVNVINVRDAASPEPEETTVDFPVPLKCNKDVVHIREELSCQV